MQPRRIWVLACSFYLRVKFGSLLEVRPGVRVMSGNDRRIMLFGIGAELLNRADGVNGRGKKTRQSLLFPVVEGVGSIDREEKRFAVWQSHQEGLVAGRMTGREDRGERAVTVNVVIVVLRTVEELPLQARLVEVLADIATTSKPVRREGVLIFRPLHDVGCVGEATNGAGVIEMQVRLHNIFDIGRIETKRLDLVNAALILVQHWPIDITDAAPMAPRIRRNFDRVATVDDGVPGGMGNQEKWNGYLIVRTISLVHLDVVYLAFQRTRLKHVKSDIGHSFSSLGTEDIDVRN